MYRKLYSYLFFFFLLSSCSTHKISKPSSALKPTFNVVEDSLNLVDVSRKRSVPVALYIPKSDKKIKHQKVVIFSHGYYQNRGGSNKAYTYITEKLASEGYFVASIQHELPTDDLIPSTGIPQLVRRPFWERGAENIRFVISELKKTNPDLDFKHIILIGHSNGGDMSMLFAHKYPNLVEKVISLDNRRMPFPRANHPKLYTLRSSDQLADEGVLPTPEEQVKYGVTIINLKNTVHNDMDNNANTAQRKEINDYILKFLE